MSQENNLTKRLTRRQEIAATSIAMGSSAIKAGVEAGVNRRSIYRWLKQPEFLDAVEDAGRQALVNHARILTGNLVKSITTLMEIRDDPAAPANARIRAAEILMTQEREYREQGDFEKRLSALENKAHDESEEELQ